MAAQRPAAKSAGRPRRTYGDIMTWPVLMGIT